METKYFIAKGFSYTDIDDDGHHPYDRRYGSIIINKCTPEIGYIGDKIDYRLLMRVLYTDKDVRKHVEENAQCLIKYIKGKPAVIEDGDLIKRIFTGREIELVGDKILIKEKLVMMYLDCDKSIIPDILSDEPRIKFFDSDLMMLFKAFKFKSRKKELKVIEESFHFRMDDEITDSAVFEKEKLMKL